MRNKYWFVVSLLCCTALLAAAFVGIFQKAEKDSAGDEISVVTSFYPVYIAAVNVAEGCGGITVTNLSEPQTGCLHDFQLTPEDMKLLSDADLFLVNGGGMESFLTETAEEFPSLPIVRTAEGVTLSEENAHVWMSVGRYRKMVHVILEELLQISPEFAEQLRENAAAYDAKLAKPQEQQDKIAAAADGRTVVSFHDAFAYLADDYGFTAGYTINLDEERQIGAGEVADVLSAVQKQKIRILFAEELYGKELAETIQKETDVSVYYLDPLVRGPYEPDSYIEGMQKNIDLLKAAFGV